MVVDNKIIEFLKQSNYIEREYGDIALKDAIKAWEYAYKNRHNVSLDYILEIHKILMRRLNPDIAGRIRNYSIRIGYQIKKFISIQLIEDDLKNWLKKYKVLTKGDSKKAHIRFEDIHPFPDGNGRTGRILYNIHRLNTNKKIHIIHEGEEQMEYYKWFR